MVKVTMRFGIYDDVQTFVFNTEEEASAFRQGVDAAIGYLEYEEEDDDES